MALDNKKSAFGFDLEERLKKTGAAGTHTHTDTHTYTDADADAKVENKTKRTYGLVQQSVFDKVTDYAKANNTSFNAIVCDLLDEFIEKNGL